MGRQIELPRALHAPRVAREALAAWYLGSLDQSELDTARLVTSELVTNAVVHGAGKIELRTEVDDHRLLIEVTDEGSGFEHTVRKSEFHELHGRGLAIVDGASGRWGIHEGTTHIWAEIERVGPRLGSESKPRAST